MATIAFSPPASSMSSRTLSAQSGQHAPPFWANSEAAQSLLAALSTSPHDFLQPTSNLHNAALALAKHLLDPLASDVSEAQAKRQKEARRKRKRGEGHVTSGALLRLKSIHLDGFDMEQIWQQCRRVLDAARAEVERDMPDVSVDADSPQVSDSSDGRQGDGKCAVEEAGVDVKYHDNDASGDQDDREWDTDDVDSGDEEFHTAEEDEGMDIEESAGEQDECPEDDGQSAEEYVADRHGLNDGFFSIDAFNRQSEFLEQQDAEGSGGDAASEEDDINWAEDPLNPKSLVASGIQKDFGEDDRSGCEEDGPTFGSMDIDAPEGVSDDEIGDASTADGDMDVAGEMGNANNIMYADFFAPPATKASKKKKGRPHPHNFPSTDKETVADPANEDVEDVMAVVRRDLFDELDGEQDASDLSDADADNPRARKSTHERRQAKLADEIRRLESQNVAKRTWMLSGEARAADRPLNSLLEEELDFERVGKPVPVITAEVSEDIESLIKRRIINRQFDEAIRRRPDDLTTGPVRRGRVELDDTKPQRGLAEEYEDDHLRKTDPGYVDAKDEKLKKEHREIAALWHDLAGKLDALSNWHFKPKLVSANLEIRTDAAAITMEDARPTTGGDMGGASMLAPQEVYAPGEEKTKAEIVTKDGMPIAKDEMDREEKSRRRRTKKRQHKAGSTDKRDSKQTMERKAVVGDLKRGGVQVIDKKGKVTDIEGKTVRSKRVQSGAGKFKL